MNTSSTPSAAATGYPIPNGRPPPPGYAYPYHAHQPPPQSAVYYDQQYFLQRQIWFRRFFASIILTCIVVFSLMVIFWLIVHPRMPEVRVTSFSVSNFNVSASPTAVSANWKASFEIYNPNKKVKISYYDVQPSVYYKGESLAETSIAPFEQNPRSLTSVDAVFSALDHYVDGKLANQINGEKARGVVSFDLRIFSRSVFKVHIAKRPLIRVICDGVPVAFSGNGGSGNLTGGPKQCRVYA